MPVPVSSRQHAIVAGAARRWFAGHGTPEVQPLEQSSCVGFVIAILKLAVAVAAAIATAVIRYVDVAVVLDVAAATYLAMTMKVSLFDC